MVDLPLDKSYYYDYYPPTIKTQNVNRLFQRELAKEHKVNLVEAGHMIAERGRKVAELAGCHWGGQDKRGVMFYDTFAIPPNAVAAPTVFFSFETVFDEPSKIITWSREMKARYSKVAIDEAQRLKT